MISTDRRASWLTLALAALFLAAHVGLAWRSTLQRSLTVDEIYHITGGYLYDKFGDYRIHPDNGVLPQRLHALPAVLAGAKPPPMEGNEYWRTSDVNVVSYQFFYESGNDHWPILLGARAVNLALGAILCLLVFAWARALAGDLAGLVALGLAAFSPTLLAHGPLATTDIAAALTLTASVGLFWRQLQSPDWRWSGASAVVFGLACVTKFSAVLLIPIFLVLVGLHWLARRRDGWRPGRTAASLALHAFTGWAIIWACFGFRYAAFAPGLVGADHFIRSWEWMLGRIGWQGVVIDGMREWKLLPEAFMFGYTHTYVGTLKRAAFLAGDYSITGWRSFFPLVFWWKSTPVELIVLTIGLVVAALRWRALRPWLLALAPLLVLAAVYGAVAITSHLNIGHRHLLPLYPALFIGGGIAIAALARRRRLAAAIIAGQAVVAVNAFPFYIPYFNVLAGGPREAWRLLVDSSLDWGQDLGGLAAWLREHNTGPNAPRVFLSYFGSAEPAYYRIEATRMLFVNGFKLPLRWYEPKAGLYAISATMLQEVYSPVRGPWTVEFERDYQDLRRFEQQFRELEENPEARERLIAAVPVDQWERAWQRYELLRHARLCTYLRARGPDHAIGHSILIFRLSEAELDAALRTPVDQWAESLRAAIERRGKQAGAFRRRPAPDAGSAMRPRARQSASRPAA